MQKQLKTITTVTRIGQKRKRNRNRNSLASELLVSWRRFCDCTKLAGLYIIGGNRKVSLINRLAMGCIWLACVSIAIHKCMGGIVRYYKYDVHTTVTYDSVSELEFPAITFCNIIGFRRSVLGISEKNIGLISHLMITNDYEFDTVKEEVRQ